MINVKAPGGTFTPAKGDGCANDTAALQALIDANLGALYFPGGRYVINETLLFPEKTGQHIIGSGMSENLGPMSLGTGPECALVWDGAAGGTMVEYQGEGLVWNGLSLWGTNPGGTNASSSSCPGTGGRAGFGILLRKPSATSSSGFNLAEAGKAWFPSLMVDDCSVGVSTSWDANSRANEASFGFLWAKNCDAAVYLQNAHSVGFSFEYVHAESCNAVFIAAGGGRLFTQSCRVLTSGTTVLLVIGGATETAFYHINGLALDPGATSCVLLSNEDSGSGNQLFRFTNGHFICTDSSQCPPSSSGSVGAPCYGLAATIDRSQSTGGGKSVLELVGCRGVAALNANVLIKGRDAFNRSHMIVRECEVRSAKQLIKTGSSNYTCQGVENYTFPCGIVPDDNQSG
jgi:hypothetical protein